MKKYIFFFLAFVLLQSLQAQSLQDAVKNIPEDNIFGLNSSTVQFLVENPADSLRKTSSSLSDNVSRSIISKDYVKILTSKIGSTEMKLLPLINESSVICIVKTVCATICDSQLYFFTDKWKPIDTTNLLPQINIEWFMTADPTLKDTENYKYVYNLLKRSLPIKYELNPNDNTMKLSVDPSMFMDQHTFSELETYFNLTPKVLTWNKTSFTE